jgi:hypothetical protein
VIADNAWAAMQGRRKLKVDWDLGANADYNSAAYKRACKRPRAKPVNLRVTRTMSMPLAPRPRRQLKPSTTCHSWRTRLWSRQSLSLNSRTVRWKPGRPHRNEATVETHVHIVTSDAPPAGVGEPGVPPLSPAICKRTRSSRPPANEFASCRLKSNWRKSVHIRSPRSLAQLTGRAQINSRAKKA